MSFKFYNEITIDYTKVQSSNQTSFPVLISGTYDFLKTVANGGLVNNSNGYDIGFYSDDGLTTKLAWETERYVPSTGEVIYWVKVPTISYTVNTVIYLAYGDGSISTDQSNINNVWDSNFKGVWHLPNGSTLTALDSTSNVNNLTLTNTPTAATGKIGGAANLDGTNQRLTKSSAIATGDLTLSGWAYGYDNNTNKTILCIGKNTAGSRNAIYIEMAGDGKIDILLFKGGSFYAVVGGSYSSGQWYHICGTFNSTNGNAVIYINGTQSASGTLATGGPDSPDTTSVGAFVDNSAYLNHFNGIIDEVRVSNVVRSADWIKTEYNNQSSPSTFYTVGIQFRKGGDFFAFM